MIINDELNALIKQKMELVKLNEEKKISDKECFEKTFKLDKDIRELRAKVIEEGIKKDKQELKDREEKVSKDYEKVVREYNKVIGKGETKMLGGLFNLDKKKRGRKPKEEKKMADEVKAVKEKKVKVAKAPSEKRTNSNCNLIAKALAMKSIKTVDATVDKVLEQKPGENKENLKKQVKSIILNVKKGTGRWGKYTWDDANFLLVEKQ